MSERKQKPQSKTIPRFRSEEEERAFWADADSADFINWDTAARVRLARLKPSTKTISLRLPESMLDELRILANQRDVPYQSLLKIFLAERLEWERARGARVAERTRSP